MGFRKRSRQRRSSGVGEHVYEEWHKSEVQVWRYVVRIDELINCWNQLVVSWSCSREEALIIQSAKCGESIMCWNAA